MSAPTEQAGSAALPEAPRPFLGWRVVAGAFVSQLFAAGLCFNAFGVFIIPLEAEFGASRGLINAGLSAGLLVMALLGPVLGSIADRGPVRALMVCGLILLGAGLHLASHATELWQAGLAFSLLVSGGSAMAGPIPTVSLVGKWFVRRRGFALGVTVAGATVASMAAPGISAYLIEVHGWREALRWMGTAGPLIGIPLVAWLVVRSPESVGQRPDGDAAPSGTSTRVAPPLHTAALLRDRNLWLASFGFALLFSSPVVMTNHLIPYAVGQGIDAVRAAVFFAVFGPFSLLGKVVFGALVDRVDLRHALYTTMVILGATWWIVLARPDPLGLVLGGICFGMGVGAVGPLQGVVVAAIFGRNEVGRVMGLGGLAGLPFVAGSGTFVAVLYDRLGSYELGFQIVIGTLMLSAGCFALVKIPAVEPGTEGA